MLIVITEDCLESLKTNKDYLSNALDAYRNGNHILMFERRVRIYDALKELYINDETMLRTIQNIYTQHNDNKNFLKIVKTYIKLMGESSEFCKKEQENTICYEIPVNYFSEIIKENIIVSENYSDTEAYISFAERAQQEKFLKIPKIIKLKYINIPGGGTETYKVFREHAQIKGQIVLCMCDSDKSTEDGPFGKTASFILKHQSEIENKCISGVYVLNVREKENLIPPELYVLHPSYSENELLNALIGKEEKFKFMKISKNTINLTEQQKLDLSLSSSTIQGIRKNGMKIWVEDILKPKRPSVRLKINSEELASYESFIFFEKLPDYLKVEHRYFIQSIFDWSCSYGKMRISL